MRRIYGFWRLIKWLTYFGLGECWRALASVGQNIPLLVVGGTVWHFVGEARVLLSGPDLTVGITIFEMWMRL